MTAEDLAHMLAHEGLYVLACSKLPGSTMPVVVMEGRGWTLRPHDEIQPDITCWQDSEAYLVAGPFTVPICSQMRQEADSCTERHSLMEGQIASLRAILGEIEPIVDTYGKWMANHGLKTEAGRAERLLEHIRELKTP